MKVKLCLFVFITLCVSLICGRIYGDSKAMPRAKRYWNVYGGGRLLYLLLLRLFKDVGIAGCQAALLECGKDLALILDHLPSPNPILKGGQGCGKVGGTAALEDLLSVVFGENNDFWKIYNSRRFWKIFKMIKFYYLHNQISSIKVFHDLSHGCHPEGDNQNNRYEHHQTDSIQSRCQ